MDLHKLVYLQKRLSLFECVECREASQLVTNAIETHRDGMRLDDEITMCHAVWGFISRALDIANLSPAAALELDALESEMAGRVLTGRLTKGELVKNESKQ